MTYQEILNLNGYEFRDYLERNHLSIPYSVSEGEDYSMISDMLIASTNSITELSSILSLAKLEVRRYKASGDKEKYAEFIDKRDITEVYLTACVHTNKTVSRLITLKQMELSELNMCEYRKERRGYDA
ncbi:MAG: hypothetical protein IK121_07030 [Lachnospiraceae bacterium]|nr:hypothetical protein [Lachnospiraceae bacterium]